MNKYSKLQQFRFDTYQMFSRGRDATFELMDSIMTTQNANSVAEFSLSPLFSRRWHSCYEAIKDFRSPTSIPDRHPSKNLDSKSRSYL